MKASNLSNLPAKVCYTAAGCLVHNNKVLLVKHKGLQIWLNPGGHIDQDELPHQAAEREFWEETGVKVRAVRFADDLLDKTGVSEFLPTPFATNIHWIDQDLYKNRIKNKDTAAKKVVHDQHDLHFDNRSCEQHLNLLYLVEPVNGVEFKQNVEETDGISWFTLEEVADLETMDNIRQEIKRAFEVSTRKKQSRK